MYFFVIFKTYVADLPIMHCLNIVRCMVVYLDCIIIMRFQKKSLFLGSIIRLSITFLYATVQKKQYKN